ncbi:MAG: hypothetical protein WAT66_04140 [Actinomycetota bacterium]
MRRAHLLPVLAFVLVACGSGEPDITATELARIMPSATAAPAGTTVNTDQVGPKRLDEFVSADDVRTKLRSLGFKLAYTVTFSTANFTPDPAKAPFGSALYGTSAIVLRDADAARKGFTFYVSRLRKRAKDLTPILAQIGKESFAFHFSSLEDTALPGVAYLFRVGNTLFSVVGVANPDSVAANPGRSLAVLIAGRAEKS